jgi:hypothetical protein
VNRSNNSQWLHDNVNTRKDEQGRTIENRSNFPLRIVAAVAETVGASRVVLGSRCNADGRLEFVYPHSGYSKECVILTPSRPFHMSVKSYILWVSPMYISLNHAKTFSSLRRRNSPFYLSVQPEAIPPSRTGPA